MARPIEAVMTLGVDPSINNCGIAVFRADKFQHARLLNPDKGITEFYDKCLSIFLQIKDIVEVEGIHNIVLEIPEYWSVAGFMARESGSLFKLNFVCGMIYTLHTSTGIVLVTPRKWKGQLSKSVCKVRLWKKYKGVIDTKEWERLDHNVVDAIGLCHYQLHGRV